MNTEDFVAERINRINIRPGVGILSVLRRVDYDPWFALAEFVDNALQSYLEKRTEIELVDGKDSAVLVDIVVDSGAGGGIAIRDNAAGISKVDFPRAFRPAELPIDRSGLNEFGMGMKSAACWFAPRWYVRTSALGEPLERTVHFDVEKIVEDNLEELDVDTEPVDAEAHYTEIMLLEPYKLPYGMTVAKIKAHLTDIYRVFTREGVLELTYNSEPLAYNAPEILEAPRWDNLDGPVIEWEKKIDFDFGEGLRAEGFAALRETGNTRRAGFALFRRKRLIQGSGDEGYRPHAIFGSPNSYRYQRLFGELHLTGFDVSHTKDGFQWDENEEPFLELLRELLNTEPIPLLRQAEKWRPTTMEVRDGAAEATSRTADAIQEDVPGVLEEISADDGSEDEFEPPPGLPVQEVNSLAACEEISFRHAGEDWTVVIELTTDPAVGSWLEFSDGVLDSEDDGLNTRALGIRLALNHPFMMRFAGTEANQIEPLLRVAAGIALAERMAREAGIRYAGAIRRNLNTLLRNGLAGS